MGRGGLRGAHNNDGKPPKFPPRLRPCGGAAEEFLVKWSAWSRSGHGVVQPRLGKLQREFPLRGSPCLQCCSDPPGKDSMVMFVLQEGEGHS